MIKSFLVFILICFLALLSIPNRKVYALGDPVKISNSVNDALFSETTTDNSGYLHLIWHEFVPGQYSTINPGIFYSTWNGDTWSAQIKLSENTSYATFPSIDDDSLLTNHIVWDDASYNLDQLPKVVYRTRNSDGVLSTIEQLSLPNSTDYSFNANLAVNTGNIPHVVYSAGNGSQDSIYWTSKTAGIWSTPAAVSVNQVGNPLTASQVSDLTSDSSGNLHLAYWDYNEGLFYRKNTAGSWSSAFKFVTLTNPSYIRIAVTPAGEVFATWYEAGDDSVHVKWTIGGIWQTEVTITTSAAISFAGLPIMSVSTDSKERAYVAWGQLDTGDGKIDLKYKTYEAGIWGTEKDINLDNLDAMHPFVYPDLWDNQHYSWIEKNAATNIWEIYYRVIEGTIQTVGVTGGTVTADPGGTPLSPDAKLVIPAGALTANTEIAIQIGPVPKNVDPNQKTIPRAFTFRPSGLVFDKGLTSTATVYYGDLEVLGTDERLLDPWYWNSATNSWEIKDGTNDTLNNTIAVPLTGFSLYGISSPIVNTTWIKPTTGEVITTTRLNFEFDLSYADGTDVLDPQTPEELVVGIRSKVTNKVVKSVNFDGVNMIKDPATGNYKGRIPLLPLEKFPNGDYRLEVYLATSKVSTQNFTITR